MLNEKKISKRNIDCFIELIGWLCILSDPVEGLEPAQKAGLRGTRSTSSSFFRSMSSLVMSSLVFDVVIAILTSLLLLWRHHCHCDVVIDMVTSSLIWWRRHCYKSLCHCCIDVVIAMVTLLLLLWRRYCFGDVVIAMERPHC